MSETAEISSGVQETDAASQTSGGAEPSSSDAPMTDEQREAAFEALIQGEYRAEYEKHVQDIIRKRLKGARENAKRISELSPALKVLAKRYGVEQSEPEKLTQAILAEEERSAAAPDPATLAGAEAVVETWRKEAEALRELYPTFDLEQELASPRFRDLIRLPDMDLRTAFEVMHRDELLPAVMRYTADTVARKLTGKLMTEGLRPAENGSDGQSASLSRLNVAAMTPGQRQEIIRRVQRGEKIRL